MSGSFWDARLARARFPAFSRPALQRVAYLDSAATSQQLASALKAQMDYSLDTCANPSRGAYALGASATLAVEGARASMASATARRPKEIVFCANASAGLNLLANSLPALSPGKAIVVSQMEHHSNYLPWLEAARREGVAFEVAPVTAQGELEAQWVMERVARGDVGILALSAMSNVTGIASPLRIVFEAAKQHGALCVVDAAQAMGHGSHSGWGEDFLVFSAHKVYGPMGVGVVAGRSELWKRMRPSAYGGGMVRDALREAPVYASAPAGFEAGTLNASAIVGAGAAMDEFLSWDRESLAAHESSLARSLSLGLAAVPGVRVFGVPEKSEGIVSFDIAGVHPHDGATLLDEMGYALRAGHHCASPLMHALGVSATLRASMGPYTLVEEARGLLNAVQDLSRRFGNV